MASSYTTESNKDTFKPDRVFESFHHKARIPILERALLAGFLKLWLKWRIVPTLPHKVLVANVVYPVVLLLYDQSLSMLLAMVGCLQSGLWMLAKHFCHVTALEDDEGNVIIDKNG